MDVSYQLTAAICPRPNCDQEIHISIGRWPGGTNDRGGIIVECGKCQKRSYIAVPNPGEASSVKRGGRVVATWDDELGNKDDVLTANNLTEVDILSDTALVITPKKYDGPFFAIDERSIYRCLNCGDEIEKPAYAELEGALIEINDAVVGHHMQVLKGYTPAPDTIEVSIDTPCSCTSHKVTFFGDYSSENPEMQANDLLFAGPNDTAMLTDIDGIYSRNECIEIFKKLLLRWRARHRVVMLAVPFIGFDYPGRESDKLELWDTLLGHTDPDRTMLVTRKKTFNSFKEASKKQGFDIEVLKKYGLLAQTIEQLDSKGAFFKTDSHAKFYAAIGPDTSEVLIGSFNLHSGEYVENLIFRTYSNNEFLDRYLLPLGAAFDFTQIQVERDVLAIEITQTQAYIVRVEKRV